MKNILSLRILFAITFLFYHNILSQSFVEEFDEIKTRTFFDVAEFQPGIFKIEDKSTGNIFFKNIFLKKSKDKSEANLVIDLRTIDTSLYSNTYKYWLETPISYPDHIQMPVFDSNYNGLLELYGVYRDSTIPPTSSAHRIYEFNGSNGFNFIFQFPDTVISPPTYSDIEKDSLIDIACRVYTENVGWGIQIQSPDSFGGYPTNVKTVYDTIAGIGFPYYMNLYDVNTDGLSELIYYFGGSDDTIQFGESHHIANYNIDKNKFELVYYFKPPELYTQGYAFGDFDSDGKQNFSAGGMDGKLWVFEHKQGDKYQVNLIDTLEITHAYIMAYSNDLDGNGKPELWIGGDAYIGGVGSTSLFVFEAIDDDSYEIVYQIDIIGVISFFAGNLFTSDLDKDRIDEVILCIDQHVLAFKCNGNEYELLYLKRNELLNQNSIYYSATTADFDSDGYPEIVISMDQQTNFYRRFSRVYKLSKTMEVEIPSLSENMIPKLYPNYPNPFNPETHIKFFIPEEENVKIFICNILGEEIIILLNEKRTRGDYELIWNGKNKLGNDVTSGIYLISLETSTKRFTIKTLLIR